MPIAIGGLDIGRFVTAMAQGLRSADGSGRKTWTAAVVEAMTIRIIGKKRTRGTL